MITRPLSLVGRRELFLFLGAYLLYSTSRYVSVGDVSTATDHARWVVDLQKSIGVNVESSVQAALDGTAVIWILNNLYLLAQMVVVPGTLIYLYRRNHEVYVKLRNTVLATWLIAMPIYALFPVAPPRLAGIGMLDTITSGGGVRLDSVADDLLLQPAGRGPEPARRLRARRRRGAGRPLPQPPRQAACRGPGRRPSASPSSPPATTSSSTSPPASS